jgi:cell division protein FtsL
MTEQEISIQVFECYKQISSANKKLKDLRNKCKHSNYFLGDYKDEYGNLTKNAKICKVCGKYLN